MTDPLEYHNIKILDRHLLDVRATLIAVGLRHRIIKSNGKSHIVTRDYKPFRVNLEVEEGIVVKYSWG